MSKIMGRAGRAVSGEGRSYFQLNESPVRGWKRWMGETATDIEPFCYFEKYQYSVIPVSP